MVAVVPYLNIQKSKGKKWDPGSESKRKVMRQETDCGYLNNMPRASRVSLLLYIEQPQKNGYPSKCQAEEDIGQLVLIFSWIHISVAFPHMSSQKKTFLGNFKSRH